MNSNTTSKDGHKLRIVVIGKNGKPLPPGTTVDYNSNKLFRPLWDPYKNSDTVTTGDFSDSEAEGDGTTTTETIVYSYGVGESADILSLTSYSKKYDDTSSAPISLEPMKIPPMVKMEIKPILPLEPRKATPPKIKPIGHPPPPTHIPPVTPTLTSKITFKPDYGKLPETKENLDELDKIVEFLKKNPTLKVKVRTTSNVPSSSITYIYKNQLFDENDQPFDGTVVDILDARTRGVVLFLQKKGIASSRIIPLKGILTKERVVEFFIK